MKRPRLRRAATALVAILATVAIGAAVGVVLINADLVGPLVGRLAGPASPAPSAVVPSPNPSAASPSRSPGAPPLAVTLVMPAGADCLGCHTTAAGGVGTATVPPIGHPLQGWTSCTSCHANDSLVKAAPGHSGIHAEQCLLCHTATTPAAVDRPHSARQDVPCLSCHGKTAPLPDSMKNRSETTCWLCHPASAAQAPLYPHPTPADGICLTCHSTARLGAIPADHEGRTDSQCSACHAPSATAAPRAPHDLVTFAGMCAFCHVEGKPTQ